MHSRKIRLKKLNNFRDLGGLVTADGKTIKYGRLYRSGKLSALPDCTVKAIRAANITTIVDLRIPAERGDHPDTFIDGIEYVILPVLCTPAEIAECERTMRLTMKKESYRLGKDISNMEEYMLQTYRSIVFNYEPKQALKKFLRLVIEEEGGILWHCSSGKDRAGICSMLIEALLGADEDIIMEDYLASRKFLRKTYSLNRLALIFAPISLKFKRILYGYMKVKPKYLKTIVDEMKLRYGSIEGYCKTELDVTDEDIALLKEKYLE